MPPSVLPLLLEVAEEHGGIVSAADAREAGISGNTLVRLAERGTLLRVARGVYRLPMFPAAASKHAELQAAVAWARANNGPQSAISHESALALYGISDVLPSRIHLTIDPKSRLRRAVPKLYVVHREPLAKSDHGVYEAIPTTTVARTIVDIARSGRHDLALAAIGDGRRLGFIKRAEEIVLRHEIEALVR